MKVLSVSWTIVEDTVPKLSGNCLGGGAEVVIRNICDYIGRKEESYLFVGKYQMDETRCGNYIIVNTNIGVPDDIKDDNDRRAYVFSKVLEDVKPDIVNFHSEGTFEEKCIDICRRNNIPFVFTDHLYIEKNHNADEAIFSMPDANIITVSNGMRRKILNDHPDMNPSCVTTILNGTDFKAEHRESGMASRYNLDGFSVLACVGTICRRKNQMQVVRAFRYLSDEVKHRVKVIFCGRDDVKENLLPSFLQTISDERLDEQLIYAGALSREEMKEVYSVADGMILPSYAEGLSIAMLESIAYGLPVIMYHDSECAEDLNDEEVCSFAEDRSDQELAKAIERWYVKNWNRDYIRKYSTKFLMDRVADEYIAYYSKIINDFKENTND